MLHFQRTEGLTRKPLSRASTWLQELGPDSHSTALIQPPRNWSLCLLVLSYPALHPTSLPQTCRHTNTQRPWLDVERLRRRRSGVAGGEGLEFYQNSICRDLSRVGITPEHVCGLGPGLGGRENTSWPGREGSLGGRDCARCVGGGETLLLSSQDPLLHSSFFLDLFFFLRSNILGIR